jgi:hypothetical protein
MVLIFRRKGRSGFMKNYIFIGAFLLCLVSVPAAVCVSAQGSSEEKEDEADAAREDTQTIRGQVMAVNLTMMTMAVRQSEYGADMYIFFINKETSFESASSLADVSVGDQVSVDYYAYQGRNIAENIAVEEPSD